MNPSLQLHQQRHQQLLDQQQQQQLQQQAQFHTRPSGEFIYFFNGEVNEFLSDSFNICHDY